MKTTTSILVSALFMITSAIAAPALINNKPKEHKTYLMTDQINYLIGYPSNLLKGSNQSVIVSYELDENSIFHVKEILTSNVELEAYIMKHIDGKKIRKTENAGSEGVVKIHFVANKEQKYFFQY